MGSPRECLTCGEPIPQRRGRGAPRKRCETCSPPAKRPDKKPTLVTFTAKPGRNVHSATLDVLTEAGRVETPLGQAALVLAARIDANQDSGGAIAAMAKQLASTLSAATAGANVVASPVDELRARRAAKRA